MAKTASQRFNEYLAECDETRAVFKDFEHAVQEKYDRQGYPYIAGYMMTQLQAAVALLPRRQREEFRARFAQEAKRFEQENLLRRIREPA